MARGPVWNFIDPERLRRAARIYRTNADAAVALGITGHAFGRACARGNIETPNERKIRQARERKRA